jgi:ribonuclease Z
LLLESEHFLSLKRCWLNNMGSKAMKRFLRNPALFSFTVLALTMSAGVGHANNCLKVTLTGTKGGPMAVNGLAGAGRLVQYGPKAKNCRGIQLQFDAGRATAVRHSQIGVYPDDIKAIFFTHTHSDHADGFADFMQLRWHYQSKSPKIDVVCSVDAKSPKGHTNSCRSLVEHIADAYIHSGEIAERLTQGKIKKPPKGPSSLANIITFKPSDTPAVVWSSGDVKVSAIRSTHTAGHASYRVDTPAGSVVIAGDASNDIQKPPRKHSTSDQVELLAKGADILVHSSTHPNMGPEAGGGMPPPIFYRQSTVKDIAAMAKRAGVKHYMMTHLTPSLGEIKRIDNWKIPNAPIMEADFLRTAKESGFKGNIVVGKDLSFVQIPAE